MRHLPSTPLALAAVLLGLTQCQRGGTVVWPELSALDAQAEKAEGLTQQHDFKGMRVLVPDLTPAADRLVASAIPANAKDPATTAELRNDLKDLIGKLGDTSKLSDADLEGLLAGVHPIVEQMMVNSGMPHVHEVPKP